MRIILNVIGPEKNKSLSRQESGHSPLERVATPSLFLHRTAIVATIQILRAGI